jgi:hypothetical protein
MTSMQDYRQGPMITRRRAAGQKPSGQLTVALATRQARKIVDKMMPGTVVNIDSRLSYDTATGTDTVITTVMFPRGHAEALMLRCVLATLPGHLSETSADSSIVITRKR